MIFITREERYLYYWERLSSRQHILDEMIDYCEANSILSFSDLLNYASKNRFDDWFKVLFSNGGTKYMVKYFTRKNHFTGRF